MSDAQSEFPTAVAELGRKSLDVLSDFVTRNANGDVSDRELMLISGALYDATSGIIDWDDADVLAAVHNHLAGVKSRYRRKA